MCNLSPRTTKPPPSPLYPVTSTPSVLYPLQPPSQLPSFKSRSFIPDEEWSPPSSTDFVLPSPLVMLLPFSSPAPSLSLVVACRLLWLNRLRRSSRVASILHFGTLAYPSSSTASCGFPPSPSRGFSYPFVRLSFIGSQTHNL